MIPPNTWEWFGYPGHFIGARECQFRLCTKVGNYLISTVGAYRPTRHGRDVEEEEQEIGLNRKYETMAFKASARCRVKGCGCRMPSINGHEIDFLPANTPGEAQRNHIKLCRKYAK